MNKFQQEPANFLSAKNAEQIDENMAQTSMISIQGGERQCVAAEKGDDAPEQRVLGARLVDHDPAEKTEEGKTIEEMVRRMERELNEEFKDFALENVMDDPIVATAGIPTKAATAAATATATSTTKATSTTVSEAAITAAVAAATETGAVEGAAVKASADATRASEAEPPPLRHHRN